MENLPIWFIWFLFTLFMSSILLLCSIELEKKWGMIAFLLVYLGLMFIPYNSFCSLYYVQWFYLFYLAGYFLNKKRLAIKKKSIHAVIFFISLILFVLLASYWTKGDYIYINQMNFLKVNYFAESLRWIYRYAVAFLGITVVFYIAKALSKTRIRESLEMIGVFSLDIYLIQRYIVEGLYPRLLSKMPADFYVPFFLWPLLVLFFVGLCMTISKLLIRKNVLLTQVLLGGRV